MVATSLSEVLARHLLAIDRRIGRAERSHVERDLMQLRAERDQVLSMRMNLMRHEWDVARLERRIGR